MDTDYIGQIQNARWNTQASGWLMRTPSWMEGGFKSGPRVSQRQFSAGGGGQSALHLDWSRTDPAAGGIKFATRAQDRTSKMSEEDEQRMKDQGDRLGKAISTAVANKYGTP
jgi:hypothetical protein